MAAIWRLVLALGLAAMLAACGDGKHRPEEILGHWQGEISAEGLRQLNIPVHAENETRLDVVFEEAAVLLNGRKFHIEYVPIIDGLLLNELNTDRTANVVIDENGNIELQMVGRLRADIYLVGLERVE